jgi:hypothetical protein
MPFAESFLKQDKRIITLDVARQEVMTKDSLEDISYDQSNTIVFAIPHGHGARRDFGINRVCGNQPSGEKATERTERSITSLAVSVTLIQSSTHASFGRHSAKNNSSNSER